MILQLYFHIIFLRTTTNTYLKVIWLETKLVLPDELVLWKAERWNDEK